MSRCRAVNCNDIVIYWHAYLTTIYKYIYTELYYTWRQRKISFESRHSNRFEISPFPHGSMVAKWTAGRCFISGSARVFWRLEKTRRSQLCAQCSRVSSAGGDYFTMLAGLTHCSTCVIYTWLGEQSFRCANVANNNAAATTDDDDQRARIISIYNKTRSRTHADERRMSAISVRW